MRFPALIMIVMAITLTVPALAADWVQWPVSEGGNDHWYALTDGAWDLDASDFNDAEAEAQSYGAHLVTIDSAAENQWVSSTLGLTPKSILIGFYQDVGDPGYSDPGGGWKWISGDLVTYTNWKSGEPNDWHGGENWCALNPGLEADGGAWNDIGPHSDQDFPLKAIMETPEPTTLSFFALGGLALLRRRRRA